MDKDLSNIEVGEEVWVKPKRLSVFAIIALILGAVSVFLYGGFMLSEGFSDFFNRYISSVIRAILAYATSWLPISLGEFLLILSPVLVASVVIYGSTRYVDSWRDVFIYCTTLVAVIAAFFSAFTLGFAPAYRGSSLDEKLGLDRQKVSAEELYETALILSERANEESERVFYNPKTKFSVMPYGIDGMNDKLIDAYGRVCDEHSFVQRLDSRLKPVMLSELMSYTHITGVYSFFTGEANINVAFPDYTIPFTAAHELSHQRGIAREDEANFMAFLVCIGSEDDYIRYSGYMNMLEYVLSALYSASPDLYYSAVARIDPEIRLEMSAYSEFFEKYRDSTASKVSETVNNTSLIIQGTEGTKSYGMVVDLAVAYYKD